MVEVKSFLEQPEYVNQGWDISQFSFKNPKPLDDNYVRKRPAHPTASDDGSNLGMSRPLEPNEDLQQDYIGYSDFAGCEKHANGKLSYVVFAAASSSAAGAGSADMTDLVHRDPLLQLGGPGLSAPYFEAPIFNPVGRPAKIQVRRAPSRQN